MSITEYIGELETIAEDNGTNITDKTIERLAKRAKELETENLSEEDILDELLEVLPKKYADDEEVYDLVAQFSDIVVAEFESCDTVENEDEE